MLRPERKPKMVWTEEQSLRRLYRLAGLFVTLLGATVLLFFALHKWYAPTLPPDGEATLWQYGVFTVGAALFLATLMTGVLAVWGVPARDKTPVWLCPTAAAVLALCVLGLGYAFIGVWPTGHKSVLMVDLHHQYAPLMSEYRQRLLSGDFSVYTDHLGLGAGWIPTFAYYLSSPLNLLLVLFPETHLTEAVLILTLLKGMGAAAGMTALTQHLYGRRDGRMVAVGVMYALSGYLLAYSWNVMWLDVVALTPVVVLALEKMLAGGRVWRYALWLGLALFANYYIGYMLCVFLVLYFAVWLLREKRSLRDCGTAFVRFAAGSLWGAGLVAALLIPTALALGRTSAAGDEFTSFTTNFSLFDLGGRLFYGATPTIRSGNLPNLYCGVVTVLLLPIYFTTRSIPLRRRLCYGGLLAVLGVSCTLTQWDLVWHGLHTPNDLPYRFSYLLIFALLLVAGATLTRLETVTPRQILGSLLGCAGYLVLWEKLAQLTTDTELAETTGTTEALLYGNLLILVIYAAVLLMGAIRRAPQRVVSRLLLVAVCAEMLFSGCITLTQMDENEYYTRRADYTANGDFVADSRAVERVEELADVPYLRLETLPRFTCVDTALYHYNGLTTFASSNPYQTVDLMGKLGYAVNGVNSYLYHNYVPVTDSLLGVQYLVLEQKLSKHPQLQPVKAVSVTDKKTGDVYERYIYRNRTALSVGFVTSDAVRDYTATAYDPFTSQQELYERLTDYTGGLYTPLAMTATGGVLEGDYFTASDDTARFSGRVAEEGQYYAFVDCRAAEDITVACHSDEDDEGNQWSVTSHEPYVIDMGRLKVGEQVEVTLTDVAESTGHVYVMKLNVDVWQAHLDILKQSELTVTAHRAGKTIGTLTTKQAGTLFLSIPYDKGWEVTVDGKAVTTYPIAATADGTDGALLGAEVGVGHHTVELTYRAPGLGLGLALSGISLLGLVAVLLTPRLKQKTAKQA